MTTPPPEQHGISLVVDRQEARGVILLRPTGAVDPTSVPILWSNLKALLEDDQNVVVDLSAIQGIDSTGIEALLDSGHLFFQRGQRFVLARPTSIVQRLIDVVCLDKVIPVFASIEAALDSFCVANAYPNKSGQAGHCPGGNQEWTKSRQGRLITKAHPLSTDATGRVGTGHR
jgi:anti-anti-sigma factor